MFWMPYSKRPVITRIPADRSAEIATLRAKLAEAERQRDEARATAERRLLTLDKVLLRLEIADGLLRECLDTEHADWAIVLRERVEAHLAGSSQPGG